jgi:hypothetical protein
MPIRSVYGFYYRIGSVDYPTNYDPNQPFGFDGSDNNVNNAVFEYSINEVENSLVSCRTLVRRSFYDHTVTGELEVGAGRSSDVMIVDSSGGYSDIITEDISTNDWECAFKAAEFLHNNQSRVFGNPSLSEFISWGDEMLSSQLKPGSTEENVFYNPKYIKNSLSFSLSSAGNEQQGRLSSISYTMYFQNLGINILYKLYFDADAFVERSDNIKYHVYRYEDIEEPGDLISPDEMREQIARKFFDSLSGGKYKTFRDFFIRGFFYEVREQFFIFSTLKKPIEDTITRLVIKQYLVDKYNNDMVYLRYTYPSLFDENEIHLIPIYDNFSNIIQDEGSSDLNLLYPLSIDKLSTELLAFGFNISPSHYDYKPVEIFHVGPGHDWVSSSSSSFRYFFPIIAIEIDNESGINLPISARFPNYRPIYGSEEGGKASEFHSILVKLLEYLLNISTSIEINFIQEYNVVIYEAGSTNGANGSGDAMSGSPEISSVGINRKRVSFAFNGDLWLLYGPLGGI